MPTGPVTKVSTDPRSARIHDPLPPPNGTDHNYVDLTADQYATCLAAWGAGKNVIVTGTAPTATKVESA
jgi:hypothetical protein